MPDLPKEFTAPLALTPAIQRYAWGDPDVLPRLLGREPDGDPWAEAWYGAHPLAPARAESRDGQLRLDDLVRSHGHDLLGDRVEGRFHGLPYLLKILAARRPLSIQVHPDREQARAGYAREEAQGIPRDAPNRCYRDRNHKPELLVALTPFFALCGFRALDEIEERIRTTPGLARLLPEFEASPEGLRRTLATYFHLPSAGAQEGLGHLVVWLKERETSGDLDESDPEYWALAAHRAFSTPGRTEPGLALVFLLGLQRLDPGNALFLPAGIPHAYLRGVGVEVGASSDNVLRAGLTPKHVDPEELLKVVRFDAEAPRVLHPSVGGRGSDSTYPVPVEEFAVECLELTMGEVRQCMASGPETILALPGDTRLEDDREVVRVVGPGGRVSLGSGQACLMPHGLRYRLEAGAAGRVYRVRVPAS